MSDIREALSERILILDGAMGTMLQDNGLSGNSEAFNFSHPEIIANIHQEYINAGADIIETNSFGANRISQAEYGSSEQAGAMALKAAQIARSVADGSGRKIWVAGSMGPTGKSLSLSQAISDPTYRPYSFDEMADAYEEQMLELKNGGCDILLLETCFDALNAKAAIFALYRSGLELPLMVSVSPSGRSGRTLTGQTMEAFYHAIRHAPILSFGVNCSLGAKGLSPIVQDVASWAECAVSCHPNAGLPNEMGKYDELPQDTAAEILKMANSGLLNIAGGCCGTTPKHISAISKALDGINPRVIPPRRNSLSVSGLEVYRLDKSTCNFTNIGERTNVSGSRKFARLIASKDYEAALQVAINQIEGGAAIIDINMDDAMLDSSTEMEKFLRYLSNDSGAAKAAIMVDSSHWETILAGLKNAQGKCIVNSISLKEGEDSFISKAKIIKALGAAVVVMAFDEEGQATTYSRKIEVCKRAYEILTQVVGFAPSDVIFDVNVLSIGTGMSEHALYGVDFIEAVRWIKNNLPGALSSGGISNLSFAFRGNNIVREAMHSVFLYYASEAGLDMGIVNPSMLQVYDQIEPELLKCVEDVIFNTDDEATERLVEKAQELAAQEKAKSEQADSAENTLAPKTKLSATERVIESLVKGETRELETDLLECLKESKGKVSEVIEGPLMSGMSRVGELFGESKMFLPQVIKSAKIMKSAVAILQPYLENTGTQSSTNNSSRKARAVFATVKGDVHDIGKNITAIVLSCNGFEIFDLGVMVPKEEILAKAEELQADIICASGLITPSLFQMEELCREMASRRLSIPLLVGGATTSDLHTAVKLSPLYNHVFHSCDASSCAVLASKLFSDRDAIESEEHTKQKHIRDLYASAGHEIADAGKNRAEGVAEKFKAETYLRGKYFEDIPVRYLKISELLPFFDWNMFYSIWGIKTSTPAEEIVRLNEDAIDVIEKLKEADNCQVVISVRFDACHSEGDDIVGADFRLAMLRQESGEALSLSDFVAPSSFGFDSPMGMFAISVRGRNSTASCKQETCADDYSIMLENFVLQTLAEAASNWLSSQLQGSLEKTSSVKIIKPAVGYASCPDHSLKRDILSLLAGRKELGISLTETCAMLPSASICGLIFAHPSACYPEIRRISKSAIANYASRRGMSEYEYSLFLGTLS